MRSINARLPGRRLVRRRLAIVAVTVMTLPMADGAALGAQEPPLRVISGAVTDSGGNYIPYATLQVGREFGALTDTRGRFELRIPPGIVAKIDVRRIGFLPAHVELPPGSDTTLVIRLAGLALPLAAQRIEAARVRTLESRGFYARMAERQQGSNSGEFVTPEEIEQRNASRPTQLLDAHHGVLVRRSGSCNIMVRCWAPFGPDGCMATIYLDGVRLNPLGEATSSFRRQVEPIYLDDLINPSTIAGIEIYARGVRAPAHYQALNGNCAIVLIWTR